jgi:hypothetical protein
VIFITQSCRQLLYVRQQEKHDFLRLDPPKSIRARDNGVAQRRKLLTRQFENPTGAPLADATKLWVFRLALAAARHFQHGMKRGCRLATALADRFSWHPCILVKLQAIS